MRLLDTVSVIDMVGGFWEAWTALHIDASAIRLGPYGVGLASRLVRLAGSSYH